MKAVFYILTKPDLLHDLLDALNDNNIHGGTIFETKGMGTELARRSDYKVTGFLRSILSADDLTHSFTLMFVLKEERIELLKEVIKSVVGDLTEPDSGIIFGVPIDFIEGLKI